MNLTRVTPRLSSKPQAPKALPKSAQQLKASLAPKPATKGPNLTQKMVAANLSGRQLSTMHAVIQGGEKNPQQVLANMQTAKKSWKA